MHKIQIFEGLMLKPRMKFFYIRRAIHELKYEIKCAFQVRRQINPVSYPLQIVQTQSWDVIKIMHMKIEISCQALF